MPVRHGTYSRGAGVNRDGELCTVYPSAKEVVAVHTRRAQDSAPTLHHQPLDSRLDQARPGACLRSLEWLSSAFSVESTMSRRPMPRARGGQQMQQAGPPVDPKLTAVADWLRNEKRSGLTTKEAVQYEKVC